jgi:hypothetical protein
LVAREIERCSRTARNQDSNEPRCWKRIDRVIKTPTPPPSLLPPSTTKIRSVITKKVIMITIVSYIVSLKNYKINYIIIRIKLPRCMKYDHKFNRNVRLLSFLRHMAIWTENCGTCNRVATYTPTVDGFQSVRHRDWFGREVGHPLSVGVIYVNKVHRFSLGRSDEDVERR